MDFFEAPVNMLRQRYFTQFKATSTVIGATLLISVVAGVLIDVFLPFTSWPNVARAVVAVPGSLSLFSALYLLSFAIYNGRRNTDPTYRPIKERWSPRVRNGMSIFFAAILIAILLSVGRGPVYTVANFFVISGFIAVILFSLPSEVERERAFYGIPDPRDKAYNARLDATHKAREERRQEKIEKERKAKETRGKLFGNISTSEEGGDDSGEETSDKETS